MSHRIIVARKAQGDISNAARWYERQRAELGQEFLEEIQIAFERAAANPFGFQCLRRKPDVRRVMTKRFPYRVFFIRRRSEIVVFRVLHSSRHDREWEKSIPPSA
jgi:plasmid stabilization system protein ParE